MMKQYLLGTLSVACMVAFSATAHAQNTSNGTGTANVSTQSNQSTSSTNAGVTALVNQYGATSMNERLDAQVPLALSGYGSFSQNSCENSVGLGATTRVFSFVFNAPKPEINCQQIVLSNAWGSESQLARNEGKPIQAEMARATSIWQLCQISDVQLTMCIRKGWIVYDDPNHPDIHKTLPNPQFEETSNSVVKPVATITTDPYSKTITVTPNVADRSEALAETQAASGQGMHGISH
jgi:hypothetical protein